MLGWWQGLNKETRGEASKQQKVGCQRLFFPQFPRGRGMGSDPSPKKRRGRLNMPRIWRAAAAVLPDWDGRMWLLAHATQHPRGGA
jgi:hypothetical protein